MSIRLRRFASLAGIAALLFMQLAMAAFACEAGMDALPVTAVMAQTGDCDEAPAVPSPLCHSHCADSGQSVAKPQGESAAPIVAPVLFFIALASEPRAQSLSYIRASELSHAPPPPVALRHCCLRL